MTITPSTDLYLLKVPIELNDENQLTFASAADQSTYFLGLNKTGETDFTYQRRDNAIRYPAHIDSIIQYNYVMYKNDNYSNKWFYARIMNMQYVNDGMTLITIEEDTFQTWQFDLTYSQCFVEREHVMDDTIGLHTLPEGLELGPYGCTVVANINPSANIVDANNVSHTFVATANVIVFQVSSYATGIAPTANVYPRLAGAFSGLGIFAVSGEENAVKVIKLYQDQSSDKNIVSIFMAPARLMNKCEYETKTVTIGGTSTTIDVMYPTLLSAGLQDMNTTNVQVPIPTKLYDNYQPKNNKLFTWPFNFLTVSNRAGDVREFHYEDFTSNTPTFNIFGALSQGCSIKLVPESYKPSAGATTIDPLEYGLSGRKYPVCAWVSDSYTNWLTQNGINVAAGLVGSVASGIAGVATGQPLMVAGAGVQVASTLVSVLQAATLPDIAQGDISQGDIAQAANSQGMFVVYKQTIRPEYAKIIDDYLSAYGYAVKQIKIPNTNGRTNWNYVKTIGSAIHADMPQESCDHINKMFDNGITLWHNPSTFRDYTQTNSIVTPTP